MQRSCARLRGVKVSLPPSVAVGRLRRRRSVVVVAVCAQNLAAVGEEAGAHQRHGAARALEARLVPLPVLERNVLPIAKPCETDTRATDEEWFEAENGL